MNREIVLIQGTIANIRVLQNDPLATEVVLYVRNDDTLDLFNVSASYVDGVADLEISADDTQVTGVYSYQLNETNPEGVVKYGALDCDKDGGCEYGKIIICETIDGTIS